MAMSERDAAGAALGGEGLFETSDQRLWFALYDGSDDAMHELPFGFNANADANLTRAEWQASAQSHR